MTIYSVGLTEAGNATDTPTISVVFRPSLSETGDARDGLGRSTGFHSALSESGLASDSLGSQRVPSLDNRSTAYPVLSTNVPRTQAGMYQWLNQAARQINSLRSGAHNTTSSITLNANSNTTTLTDSRIGAQSFVHLSPLTESAADESWWISSQSQGSATISHSNSPDTTRTYRTIIVA